MSVAAFSSISVLSSGVYASGPGGAFPTERLFRAMGRALEVDVTGASRRRAVDNTAKAVASAIQEACVAYYGDTFSEMATEVRALLRGPRDRDFLALMRWVYPIPLIYVAGFGQPWRPPLISGNAFAISATDSRSLVFSAEFVCREVGHPEWYETLTLVRY